MGVAPLLITGMHRSGTSATARLLSQAGLDIGDRLMSPRLDNPLGYYEDLDFAELNVALVAAGVGDPGCRPDWAYPERIVAGRLAALAPRAAELIARRGDRGRAWGFKDPRTAVLLDFYEGIAPQARHLFVYREPWAVVDSLMRSRDRPLHGKAHRAARAWIAYNERLLEFRERHPQRTVLVHIDAVATQPRAVVALAQAQVGALASTMLDAGAADGSFVPGLLRPADEQSVLAELIAADHPAAIELYQRLQDSADVSGRASGDVGAPALHVRRRRGALALGVVLAGQSREEIEADVATVVWAQGEAAPGNVADAAIDLLDDDVIAVVFDSSPRLSALAAAAAALADDPALGAVLLVAGDDAVGASRHDPLERTDPDAAIVVRRDAWLTTRGFAALRLPAGFEAWAYAVACAAHGVRVVRLAGGHTPATRAEAGPALRGSVLEQHPGLAVRLVERTERERDDLRAALDTVTLERDHLEISARDAQQTIDMIRSTRIWRAAMAWYRVRGRFGGSRTP